MSLKYDREEKMSEPNMKGMMTSNNNTANNQDTPAPASAPASAPAPARSDRSSSNENFEIKTDDRDDAAGRRPTSDMAELVREEYYDGDDDDDAVDDENISSLNFDKDIIQAEAVQEDDSDDLENYESEPAILFYDEEYDRIIEVFPSTRAMQFWDPDLQTYRLYYNRRIDEYLAWREKGQVMVEGQEGLWKGVFDEMPVIRMAAAGRRNEDVDWRGENRENENEGNWLLK